MESQSSLLSFYLRTNYALKEKYLFTVTARSDASSKFPKTNRVGYFPSAGFAWRITEEKFMQPVKWLNELKLRASAGYTGTQNLGDNLFYTLFTPLAYASQNALVPTQLGNDKIKWESTLQKDFGIDFAMFNSKLRGAIGYYDKGTTRLLMAYTVPASTGFSSTLVNLADINNRGIEIDLRVEILKSRSFHGILLQIFQATGQKFKILTATCKIPATLGTMIHFTTPSSLSEIRYCVKANLLV